MKLTCVVSVALVLAGLARADEALLAPICNGAAPVDERFLQLGSLERGGSSQEDMGPEDMGSDEVSRIPSADNFSRQAVLASIFQFTFPR